MKFKDGFVVRKIGDSFYAVPVTNNPCIGNGMVKLNETAYLMWKNMEEGKSLPEIAEIIAGEYNVDKETALEDLRSFARELGKVGILEGTDEA